VPVVTGSYLGPNPAQYGRRHAYARSVHSGAGNCICGRDAADQLHTRLAPNVPKMSMGLFFDDVDPVARCLVPGCAWHGHGDSMTGAVTGWTAHLAAAHSRDWED
jgi:hypothetical protein